MENSIFFHEESLFSKKEFALVLKKKFSYLQKDLEKTNLDVDLKNILITFFTSCLRSDRSRKSYYYPISLIEAIRRAIHKKSKNSMDMNVLYSFILYDFNHNEIIEYYLKKIHNHLDSEPATELHSIQNLLLITQNIPICRYKKKRNRLGKHLSKYHLSRLDLLESEALGIFPSNRKSVIVHLKDPPRIFMVLLRIALEKDVIMRTKKSKELFKLLSSIIRGPDNKLYAANTLSNAFLYNDEVALDQVILILEGMIVRAGEAKVEIQNRLAHVN